MRILKFLILKALYLSFLKIFKTLGKKLKFSELELSSPVRSQSIHQETAGKCSKTVYARMRGMCSKWHNYSHSVSDLPCGRSTWKACSTLASDQPLVYLVTGSGQVNLGIVKLLVKCISGSLWMCPVKDVGPSQSRILCPSLVWSSHFHHQMTRFLLPLGPWSRDSICPLPA